MWPDLITRWNLDGLDWRRWGWVEMAWILHTSNMTTIAATKRSQMRKYLQQTRDDQALAEWDNLQMADKHSDQTD